MLEENATTAVPNTLHVSAEALEFPKPEASVKSGEPYTPVEISPAGEKTEAAKIPVEPAVAQEISNPLDITVPMELSEPTGISINQVPGPDLPAEPAAETADLTASAKTLPATAPRKPPAYTDPAGPGITNLRELKSLEVLRTEFASSMFKPKVILSYETISFNKACVKLLPDTRYVNVLIDRAKKRIIILPVNKHAKDALQWCSVTRTGDIRKRQCTAKKFGEKLYDMMQWIKENKYRILAYYQEIEGVRLLVFNLRECEMVVPDFITTKSGKVIKSGKVYLPGEYDGGFGMPLVQHSEANIVELDANYTLSDKDMDITIADVRVRGKVPTEEEIIMSQYRKEKAQEVFVNA